MKVLRSRDKLVPVQSPLQTLKGQVIEPITPVKTHEPSTYQSSPSMGLPPSSHSPNPNPNLLGLGSDSVSSSGPVRRRSLRLASKSPNEGTGNVSKLVSRGSGKRKSVGKKNGEDKPDAVERVLDFGAETGRVSESSGKKAKVLNVKEGIEEERVNGLGESGLFVDRVTERGFGEEGTYEVNEKDATSLGDFGFGSRRSTSWDDDIGTALKAGKRKLNADLNFVDLVSQDEDGGKRVINLRSRKRIAKGSTDMGVENDVKSTDLNDFEKVSPDDEKICVTTRSILSREDKGKGKLVDDSLPLSGIDQAEDLGLKSRDESADGNSESADGNAQVMGRSRFSREEKGKGKLDFGDFSKAEMSVDIAVSDANAPLQNAKQVLNTSTGYKERFRNIAKQNASRFAHFAGEEEDEEEKNASLEFQQEMPSQQAVGEEEDWPGPFSTAMKIMKDRLNVQQESPFSVKTKPVDVSWVPKKRQDRDHPKPLAPSLQDVCLRILAKNADALTSLDNVPDAMRHKLSHLLCDSRRMNNRTFDLLIRGSPTELRVWDCSWLTGEQFSISFEQCDTSNLTVLQLDLCGRCMPDYIIQTTLARSLNSALTTISLKGAYSLSDIGLQALVSSCPALRSINLSQCSLISSAGIDFLANSLGLVLRELYIDDCQNIEAMLVLPALKKLAHLEVLSLAGIQTVCDDFFKKLMIACGHNMKELVLTNCVKLTDSSMKVIAETCSGLSALHLLNLRKLTDSALGYLANVQGIQTLKLCRNEFSDEAIAAFLETSGESLKELSLNNVNKVGHNTAISLAKRSRNLQSLDLSFCRNVMDEALGLIVDSCLSLRVLKLFGCTQVTNVFLDGHSNLDVQIIGLKLTPISHHLDLPNLEAGPLHYSVPSF